ncbi:hypothetical protein ONS95_006138 [Cadophora gregata]|uniref:uncharacterized protein n=1 Tax=Cadophora gregata TaxID=51156 RepID=UPI0026DB6172|nr:uncharacterized protein ONS95_006138 [Cadophora gregata]KAK0102525.1 hypothetical protein ONS95_006138 [Cadophora gregata]KAK0104151.1 hypothetical protein ONS96_005246 [Cadophora gregata f. sp. sojae]
MTAPNIANVDRRTSISDRPPAYEDGVHFPPLAAHHSLSATNGSQIGFPEDDALPREPSIAESLPGYSRSDIPLTTLPPPNPFREVDQHVPFFKNYGRGILIAAVLLVVAPVAGVIGGIVARNARRDASDQDIPSPKFLALAAAECQEGTFVFWQTSSSDDIWMIGTLTSATWNRTSYAYIPATRLDLGLRNQSVLAKTNLTAVCWREASSTLHVRFYFYLVPALSPGNGSSEAQLTEGHIRMVPAPWSEEVDTYVPGQILKSSLAMVPAQGSLAATYLPSQGVKLYYSYIPGDSLAAHAEIKELSYSPATDSWSESTTQALAHDRGTGLAVASVDDPAKTEVYIFFVNTDIQLSTVRWTNATGWDKEKLPLIFNDKASITDPVGKRAVNIIAVAQGSSSTTQLYFIQDHHIRGPSYVALSAYSTIDKQDYDMDILPDAIEHPGLIASTSYGETVRVQLFYVTRVEDAAKVNGVSQAGTKIVNATLGVGPGNNLTLLTYLSIEDEALNTD